MFVCAIPESFSKHTSVSVEIKAAALGERVFINPNLLGQEERILGFLTHELSHLHLTQRLGWRRNHWNLPEWFREGLATYVSGGGGADMVGEQEARTAILSGLLFKPESSGHLLSYRVPSTPSEQHMLYRQSMMFIAYLESMGSENWRRFLLAVQEGEDFNAVFERFFGGSVDTVFNDFITEVRKPISSR